MNKAPNMKHFSLIILLFFALNGFSKGGSGYFYIKGKAYSANNTLLKDALISVTHNGETTEYMTSTTGQFKIKIKWTVPCKSGIPADHYERIDEENNEPWIQISFKCQGTTVENEWKKYSGIFRESVQSGVQYLDLYFNN
jgi:hypothetical protein